MTNSPTKLLATVAVATLLSHFAWAEEPAASTPAPDASLEGVNLPALVDQAPAADETATETEPAPQNKPEPQAPPEPQSEQIAQYGGDGDSYYRPNIGREWQDEAEEPAPETPPAQAGEDNFGNESPRAQPWGATGIEQDDLGSVSATALGLYSEDAGGLPRSVWNGSTVNRINALLERLSVEKMSLSQALLLRRLLLSDANSPLSADAESVDAFASLRISTLLDLGAVDDLLELTEQIGPQASQSIPGLDELVISRTLINDGLSEACALPQNTARSYDDFEGWWQRLTILCLIKQDQLDEANRQRAIAEELQSIDPLSLALIDRMTGRSGAIPASALSDVTIDAIHWALYQAIGETRPPQLIAQADAATAALIARSTNVSDDLALLAAEIGARNGSVSISALRQIYARVTAPANEVIQPIDGMNTAPSASSPEAGAARTRAMELYRIGTLPDDLARGDAIASALKRAQAEGRFDVAARLYAPLILSLDRDERFSATSDIYINALLVAGEDKAASKWHDIAVDYARNGGQFGFTTLARAWPHLVFASEEAGARGIQVLAARWHSTIAANRDPALAYQQSLLMFATMEAMGLRVDEGLWEQLAQDAPARIDRMHAMPNLPLWHQLNVAIANRKMGEALLIGLDLLSLDSADKPLHPAIIASIAGGLAQMGLEPEARDLLQSLLVARGL